MVRVTAPPLCRVIINKVFVSPSFFAGPFLIPSFLQTSVYQINSCRITSTSSQSLSPFPHPHLANRTLLVMLAGQSIGSCFVLFLFLIHVVRSRKVRCNRIPGQDKVLHPLHLAIVDSLSLGVVQCQVGPYQPAIINTLTRMAALHVQELSMHVCSHLSHPNIYSFDSSPSLQAFRPTSY